ncbi:Spy/CpxP family protein refolding chaperone [Phenylobacterium sp.]|uniref:Spy/CpxP family protein refolding chaperone n=1 Tax=Phenylobacterium sp. TaxID=1871053 RepID=UPI0025F8C152|nr:Spy/CpxP family protein refolding chaperone [Phenylobacterium sp.]
MSKPMTWLLAGAAITLSGAALSGVALAQTGDQARREAVEDAGASARRDERPERAERREVRIYRQGDMVWRGGRPDQLSDILQLRPDQEPALKAFLGATRRDGPQRDHMVKFERDGDRTTLQRLDDMQARMAEQQADTNRRIAAIRTFYGQLDAKQRKAFDALPMLMFSGPAFGPMLIPAGHHMPMPPEPPEPPEPPKPPRL